MTVDHLPQVGQQGGRPRFGEAVKFLPVLFVIGIIVTLYGIYMWSHLVPLWKFHSATAHQDPDGIWRVIVEACFFHIFTLLLVICFFKSTWIEPGGIPDEPQWNYPAVDMRMVIKKDSTIDLNQQEKKRSGERRHCKWCGKYKPDRCHHCRVCRTCVLRMDHHCPWIYNCVGFRNHKYFFLLLFYSMLVCHLITFGMLDSVKRSLYLDTPFLTLFLLLFGETLAAFLGLLVTMFFGFHIWLMLKALTTIEFCEKSLKNAGYENSIYDYGVLGNIKAVLGPNIFLWLLPCSNPEGSGLSYTTEGSRLKL